VCVDQFGELGEQLELFFGDLVDAPQLGLGDAQLWAGGQLGELTRQPPADRIKTDKRATPITIMYPVPSLEMWLTKRTSADTTQWGSGKLLSTRRTSSVGDGRHSESRSDSQRSTVAKRASAPPPQNPTRPAGRHRTETQLLTEWQRG
jgi:hypothetical protein